MLPNYAISHTNSLIYSLLRSPTLFVPLTSPRSAITFYHTTILPTTSSAYYTSFDPSAGRSYCTMARSKLTPRRVIAKPSHRHTSSSLSLAKPTLSLPTHPPTEVFTSDTGVRGEVLRLGHRSFPVTPPLSDTRSHTHVILLPGNPGVIEYYRPLLRSVFHRLPQDVKDRSTLHALGLPGHDVRVLNGTRQFVIADHVRYCTSYLHSEELSPNLLNSNIIFVGHSYGSFLAMKLLESLGSDIAKRTSFIMLMPALHQMGQCAGALARLLLADTWYTTTWTAWGLSAFAPPVLKDAAVQVLGHDASVVDVTKALLDGTRRGLYLNICSLARDEVNNILEPSELKHAKTIAKRSLFLYADNDQWCTSLGRERIQDAFGDELQTQWAGEGVKHAFVLSKVETEKLARDIAPWISEKVRW